MTSKSFDIETHAREFQDKAPADVLRLAFENFNDIAISFSGAEDVVLVDMAKRINPDVKVFSLDTGRLHSETYRFLERVREHYHIELEALSPDAGQVAALVREKGLYSFYKDGHKECCGVRKIGPLRRKLETLDAWITGQRKDQSPTRTNVSLMETDAAFSSPGRTLYKFNPLANWTSKQVWGYIRANDVPYNALHEQGYVSIGCEPCTRRVLPNQHEREGRWWWEEETLKECGLHAGNLEQD